MTIVAIPNWNTLGFLPPIDQVNPTSMQRSPYPVSLLAFVRRFATSPERVNIMLGFLDFRALLHSLEICSGFQWLDGSFMEQVEVLQLRAPRDIDVTTFLSYPATFDPKPEDIQALDHNTIKTKYQVDNYFVELDTIDAETLVAQTAYWYSVWSHTRNQAWKGFLQLDLAPTEDLLAKQWLLETMMPEKKL